MFVPPLGNPPGAERRLRDWHEARFSSGPTGDQPAFDAFWQDLYRAGAEVVLAGWAAGSGYYSIGKYGFITWANHMIMPWVVLSLLFAANYARMSRGNLIETMSEDYIRTARAKGLTEKRVVMRHGLRSSMTPLVTMIGMDVATLLGGAIITETVFNLPGIGAYVVQSVTSADFNAILSVTIVAAVAVAVMNLLVDVLYAYLDPRVRYT